jgi:predicted ester cyclase
MSDASKHLVRRHFEEIWNERNLAACDELIAEDFTEHAAAPFAPSAPGRVHGPAAMRATVGWLVSQFPDIHMEIECIIAERELVAVRVLSTGTNLGTVDGGPRPTGKSFAARQSHWFRIADRQLAEHWSTRDDLSTMLQLGLIQPPKPLRPPAKIELYSERSEMPASTARERSGHRAASVAASSSVATGPSWTIAPTRERGATSRWC